VGAGAGVGAFAGAGRATAFAVEVRVAAATMGPGLATLLSGEGFSRSPNIAASNGSPTRIATAASAARFLVETGRHSGFGLKTKKIAARKPKNQTSAKN
jgi:hypothetical protein